MDLPGRPPEGQPLRLATQERGGIVSRQKGLRMQRRGLGGVVGPGEG